MNFSEITGENATYDDINTKKTKLDSLLRQHIF